MTTPRAPWQAPLATFLTKRGHLLVLVVIAALAATFRFYGMDWDQGALYHPDERAILDHVSQLHFPINHHSAFFHTDSAWNPHWFPYGSFPLYLLKFVAWVLPPWFHNPDAQRLVTIARGLNATVDVITVLLVYAIASR
ncbi:MAG: hypothetical protein HY261_03710, partial [Chloroflexi bacterium]|nr:hypothetical protein [Chloroflexota bacterium]